MSKELTPDWSSFIPPGYKASDFGLPEPKPIPMNMSNPVFAAFVADIKAHLFDAPDYEI
jgi:hypothetical protein